MNEFLKKSVSMISAAVVVSASLFSSAFAAASVSPGPGGSGFSTISGNGASKPRVAVNDDGSWVACYLETGSVKCRSFSAADAPGPTVTVAASTGLDDSMNNVSVAANGTTGTFWVGWMEDGGSKVRSYYSEFSKGLVPNASVTKVEILPWVSTDWQFKITRLSYGNNVLAMDYVANRFSNGGYGQYGGFRNLSTGAVSYTANFNGTYMSFSLYSGGASSESAARRKQHLCLEGPSRCILFGRGYGGMASEFYYGGRSTDKDNSNQEDYNEAYALFGTKGRSIDVDSGGGYVAQWVPGYEYSGTGFGLRFARIAPYSPQLGVTGQSATFLAKNKDGTDISQVAAHAPYNYHKPPTLVWVKSLEGNRALMVFTYAGYTPRSSSPNMAAAGSQYGGLQAWYWDGANGSAPQLVSADLLGGIDGTAVSDVGISRYGKVVIAK